MARKKESLGEAEAGEDRKRKKTMGRQKIEMKRIEVEEKRQVCFSKRKNGLFKKASDLSVLCGAHVAAIAFSPGGKPFSFGRPTVQAVVDRFFTDSSGAPAMGPAPVNQALLEEFYREEDLLAEALEAERNRKEGLDAAIRRGSVWTGGVDGKSVTNLLAMRGALEKVQADMAERLHEFMTKEPMGTDVGGVFHYPGASTLFMADGGVNHNHSHDQVIMDVTQTMMNIDGDVDRTLPFAPMMMLGPPYFGLNHGAGYGHPGVPPYLDWKDLIGNDVHPF